MSRKLTPSPTPRRLSAIAYIWSVAAVLVGSTVAPMPELLELNALTIPITYIAATGLLVMPFIRAAVYRASAIALTAFVMLAQIMAVGLSNIRRPWLSILLIGALLLGLINTVITDHDIERPWARRDA